MSTNTGLYFFFSQKNSNLIGKLILDVVNEMVDDVERSDRYSLVETKFKGSVAKLYI